MKKKFVFFDRISSALIALLILLVLLMMTFGPRTSLDARLYYTGDEARALLSSFDVRETRAYFINELFDLLLISSYSALFYIRSKKAFPQNQLISYLALLPGFFDLIETSFILYALRTPSPQAFFDWLGIATFMKWTAGAGVASTLILGSISRSRQLA